MKKKNTNPFGEFDPKTADKVMAYLEKVTGGDPVKGATYCVACLAALVPPEHAAEAVRMLDYVYWSEAREAAQ